MRICIPLLALFFSTAVSAAESNAGNVRNLNPGNSAGGHRIPTASVIVRVTQPVTVYLVPYASMSTPTNAQIAVYPNAMRLQ